MTTVMSVESGSRWIESHIRHGLRGSWGPDDHAANVVVEAKLQMPDDREGPKVFVTAVAFYGVGQVSMIAPAVVTDDLSVNALWRCGAEIAAALRKALDRAPAAPAASPAPVSAASEEKE